MRLSLALTKSASCRNSLRSLPLGQKMTSTSEWQPGLTPSPALVVPYGAFCRQIAVKKKLVHLQSC